MVMIFENNKARNQLLQKGEVFTWRKKRRMMNFGEDWIAHRRGGASIATVYICYFGEFLPSELRDYVDRSGFGSLEEWTKVILQMNNGIGGQGHLYHVRNLNIRL